LCSEAAAASDALVLHELSTHRSRSARIAVAENRASDDETIGRLLDDTDEVVA